MRRSVTLLVACAVAISVASCDNTVVRKANNSTIVCPAGCGSTPTHSKTVSIVCGSPAYAGCSVSKPRREVGPITTGGFPDLSSYQGCPAFQGPVIFKVYEGGYGIDHSAYCNAARVHKLKVWAGVYAFLRPANCAGQGYATVQIVRQIGGVPGPIVADAEVPLPSGCVSAFLHEVRTTRGGPVDIYTSPGTWPGGSLSAPLWVATYGSSPGCVVGVCSHVAWQFTDEGHCGAGILTDCSIDNGITKQTIAKPTPKPSPSAARIAYLRVLAHRHDCYAAKVRKRVRACVVWGDQVKALEGRR